MGLPLFVAVYPRPAMEIIGHWEKGIGSRETPNPNSLIVTPFRSWVPEMVWDGTLTPTMEIRGPVKLCGFIRVRQGYVGFGD